MNQDDEVPGAETLGKGDMSALVAAAVAGKTLAEIAVRTGVSVSTVQRRLASPEIKDEIAAARRQQLNELLGAHMNLAGYATDRLAELVIDVDEKIALRAIALVLGNAMKLSVSVDMGARLAEVEAKLKDESE